MPVDPELFAIMACPQCKGPLELADSGESILCQACALRFAVQDGIPNMLLDEASPLEADSSSVSKS